MRKNFITQLSLTCSQSEETIGNHVVRDDIDGFVFAMEEIFSNKSLRNEIIALLKKSLALPEHHGRPGMDYWTLFVLATLRLTINCDYDRLHNLANHHRQLRQLLGHGDFDWNHGYRLSTIKANTRLLSEEVIMEINLLVVRYGQSIIHPYSQDRSIHARCDSFVAQTNVHYPTDISLLHDALSKVINLAGNGLSSLGIPGLRQYKSQLKKLKKLYNKARNSKKNKRGQAMESAHQAYIEAAQQVLTKIDDKLGALKSENIVLTSSQAIAKFHAYALTLIDQIDRRVLQGETIPHNEKIFSLFQPHTEWIVKGKSGIPFELGIKVAIVQDQHQFILHHQIMEKQQDVDIAVAVAQAVKERYGGIDSMSYDRGFWSADNESKLLEIVRKVVLPKKGYLDKKRQEIESDKEHVALRMKHSAVESGINALQVHGLKKVPDSGIEGYKRYVALGVLGYNIHKLGAILLARYYKQIKKKAS
jgi:hypothetical protein